MLKFLAVSAALSVLASGAAAQTGPQTYTLKVTPETVAWGNYNAAAKPVLRIKSGDTVIFDTLLTNSPSGLDDVNGQLHWAPVMAVNVRYSF